MIRREIGKHLKNCNVCDIKFYARVDRPGLFCSRECQIKGREKRIKNWINFICEQCKKDTSRRKGFGGIHKFCSRSCLAKSKIREINPNWKGGISERSYKSRKAIKEAKKIKKECEKCGSKENLQGHHIIKYSVRPDLGDDINNIEIICASCHAKEHPKFRVGILTPRVRNGIMNKCHICENEYYISQCKIGKSRWCSKKCTIIGLNNLRNEKNAKKELD